MKKTIFILIGMIFLFSFVSAETSYCCEKTVGGSWCQNSQDGDSCDSSFRKVPSSCESTSYCKLGCCYDSQEGTCMENTPQKVCEENGGVWGDDAECDVPQCQLGCCLIGEQASFVTQTRCKRMSSLYGLEIDFRTDISDEITCITSATSSEKGACVIDEGTVRTCKFITQKECVEEGASLTTKGNLTNESETFTLGDTSGEVSFYKDVLCSAEELATECGPTKETTCVEGSDEVYFLDSCGNVANIYDASKINDKTYWSKVMSKEESCNYGDSNANSATCGNCDYYLGSSCKEYKRGEDRVQPNYGDNVCSDLNCEYGGKEYKHGETWCANSPGTSSIAAGEAGSSNVKSQNLPGSRYFRVICYNGEISVEPCADYRQEVCAETSIGGFRTAACVVNMWQDCYSQLEKEDCENRDKRDCKWILSKSEIEEDSGNNETEVGCVPLYAPGFNFWEDGDAEDICGMLTTTCVVTYEKKILGSKTCVSNCECLTATWAEKKSQACISLGDCGSKMNYLGINGEHDDSAVYLTSADDTSSSSSSSTTSSSSESNESE